MTSDNQDWLKSHKPQIARYSLIGACAIAYITILLFLGGFL